MLTKKELQWLDNRGKFSCWYCPDIPQAMCTMGERPAHCAIMDTDWKDAAEFSERVAAKLVDPYFPPMDKGSTLEFGHFFMPPADRLRCARIAVEEEMDNG